MPSPVSTHQHITSKTIFSFILFEILSCAVVILITILTSIKILVTETDCGRRQLYRPADGPVSYVEPYFDLGGLGSQRNISAVEGKTAKLSCTVRNLGDRMVRFVVFYSNKVSDQRLLFTYSFVCLFLCLSIYL